MSKTYKISKGKDIQLEGIAPLQLLAEIKSPTAAVKPTDYRNIKPKLEVQIGDEVRAGDSIFHDKGNPAIKFTSPVSGEVAEIIRGDRRALLEIKILADAETKYKQFNVESASDAESIKSLLLESGLWPSIVQRPFGTLANPEDVPKAIHISTFNSAPLAGDYGYALEGDALAFQKGLDALSKLTSGTVHLNHKTESSSIFTKATGVQHNYFDGPHPAGLVGIQIHHLDAINKGDIVWTINPQSVVFIGRLFTTGSVDQTKLVALTGSEMKETGYVKMVGGSSVEALLSNKIKEDGNVRVVSGDVLTGTTIGNRGYLGFFDNSILALPEGDHHHFLGWLFPSYLRPTISNALPFSKFLKKRFRANTNMHGELRAFVVSGQYEKVLPMDILPVHLLKAILAQDLEAMENLGIYEILEEDLALCEFVCTSKIEVQEIVRAGLELMEEEG
jgi:Na+-transporting NADH:ubiquinone oxidoreductase subunit A